MQLFTPDLDAGVAFFTDYPGLTANGQDGDTVRLHTFDDYEQRSLVLTACERPGLGRLALRTSSEQRPCTAGPGRSRRRADPAA
ncbi:hypothetical protein GCM10027073_06990 [Streptomyces chlorus]